MRLSVMAPLVAALIAGACSRATPDVSKVAIVGGQPAGGFPFMAALFDEGATSAGCGGALVAPRVVVTAAHCVSTPDVRKRVALGVRHNQNLDAVATVAVDAIVSHPDYSDETVENDIALLFLSDYDAATLPGEVAPIALDEDLRHPEVRDQLLEAIGWGNTTSFGNLFKTELRQASLPVVPLAQCRAATGYGEITDKQICAGNFDFGGADSCQGDSGGPLVSYGGASSPRLTGVVSWGLGCALAGKPGVYTRVSSYVPWIKAEMQRFAGVGAKLSGENLAQLVAGHCYARFKRLLASGDELSSHVRTLRPLWSQSFLRQEEAPSAVIDQNEPSSAERCDFKLPDGEDFSVALEPADGAAAETTLQFVASRRSTGEVWTTASKASLHHQLHCLETSPSLGSLQMQLNEADGSGFVFSGSGEIYLLDKTLLDAPSDEVALGSCEAADGAKVELASATVLGLEGAQMIAHIELPAATGSLVQTRLLQRFASSESQVITAEFIVQGGSQEHQEGELRLVNGLEQDIHTWRLACSVDMQLNGRQASTEHSLGGGGGGGWHFLSLLTKYSWEWETPGDAAGTIPAQGGEVRLKFLTGQPLSRADVPYCTLNGSYVEVHVTE